jgi:hypothetical protein
VSFQELVSIRDGNSLPSFRILPLQPAFPLEASQICELAERRNIRPSRAIVSRYSTHGAKRIDLESAAGAALTALRKGAQLSPEALLADADRLALSNTIALLDLYGAVIDGG